MPTSPADLTAFQQGGVLWAVNQFVLWPLGLALSVSAKVEDGVLTISGPIELREWQDDHIETIEDDSEAPDFDRWLAFCDTIQARLMEMPWTERSAAYERLLAIDVVVDMKTGRVLSDRPQAHFVKVD